MSSHLPPRSGQSVCTLQRSNQTSIRSFFASSAKPKREIQPRRHGAQNNDGKGHNIDQQRPCKKRDFACKTRVSAGYSICHRLSELQRKNKSQQLYLDLGQRNFAKTMECDLCGMLFVHGLSEDAKRHASICRDYQQGVSFPLLESARVLQKIVLNKKSGKSSASTSVAIVEVRTMY